jgi:hypothetical protein
VSHNPFTKDVTIKVKNNGGDINFSFVLTQSEALQLADELVQRAAIDANKEYEALGART